jgi:hypothetical protein
VTPLRRYLARRSPERSPKITALPHLTRRDGVYYWRRKVRLLIVTET